MDIFLEIFLDYFKLNVKVNEYNYKYFSDKKIYSLNLDRKIL